MVSAMFPMHEKMHQRAQQQKRVGPPLRDVGAMLCPEEISGNAAQDEQRKHVRRPPEAAGAVARRVVVVVHDAQPLVAGDEAGSAEFIIDSIILRQPCMSAPLADMDFMWSAIRAWRSSGLFADAIF